MTTRFAISALVLSCAAVAGAYLLAFMPGGAPPLAAWCLSLGSAGALASAMALGAMRRGRLPRAARIACAVTFATVAGAFAAALLLPGDGDRLWLGLPLRAAIIIYGIGVVPLLVLPWAYAASFDADTLNDADLDRLRALSKDGTS